MARARASFGLFLSNHPLSIEPSFCQTRLDSLGLAPSPPRQMASAGSKRRSGDVDGELCCLRAPAAAAAERRTVWTELGSMMATAAIQWSASALADPRAANRTAQAPRALHAPRFRTVAIAR